MTNIVLIVGNLGADPVTRSTSGGDITTISVATTRRWNTKDGDKREETEWHRVICFNGLGKTVAKYTRKGSKVSVQGRLHYSKWQAQDGTDKYGVEIYADEVGFLDRKSEGGDS